MNHKIKVVLEREDGRKIEFAEIDVSKETSDEEISKNWKELEELILDFANMP